MYRILTLTDFSENSKSALEFSKKLAIKNKSEVTILHTIAPLLGTITLSDQSVELNNILFENSKERMDQIVSDFNIHNIETNAIIKNGNLIPILNQIILELKINLLIISTHGYGNNSDKITGEKSSYILANVHVPILLIPSKYIFSEIEKASFVHQLEKPKLNHLLDSFEFLKSFNLHEIDLLHIKSDEQDVFSADKNEVQATKKSFPDKIINFTFIEGEFVVDSLLSFLEKSQSDLLIISSNRKTFWKRFIAGNIHMDAYIKFNIPIFILTDSPT